MLRKYYLFKKENIKEEKSIFKKTRVTKYILKKKNVKLFKALNNKTDASKKLAQHVQTAILLPANPTALPRPAQPTQSAKDAGHATPNTGSIKIVLPETTAGQMLPGRLQGDYPKWHYSP